MFSIGYKWMIVFCFFIHVVFLLSIFDIYFKSPIVEGIVTQENDVPAPAKRLVLIVGDGLRADSFFELNDDEPRFPYLRNIIEHRGRWGISHTHVPTESRPGHVALIAGFYEDPSAIFKGWKDNPIEFDSVFNRSSVTFGWGSPDILSMFRKRDTKAKIVMNTYSSTLEDITGKAGSAAKLSLWSFEKFEEFLASAKTNRTLYEWLHRDKIVFFLHLLGIDEAGHSGKPHSEVYIENIKTADVIVQKVEQLVKEFYEHDEQTVYVFTSDHGMTDWGSHGDGSAAETETPFVAWGAGIKQPQAGDSKFDTPKSWRLGHLQRFDMEQADMTPLMSVLLGIPIPVHSVGTLPIDIMNVDIASKSKALLLNSRQILAQFRRKRELVEDTTLSFLYKPFKKLSNRIDDETVYTLRKFWENGEYEKVIQGSKELIRLCLSGLEYYHNYYQKLLLFCISASYVGWIAWLFLDILFNDDYRNKRNREMEILMEKRSYIVNVIFAFSILVTVFLLAVQSLPYQYYLYCCLPFVIWWNVLRKLLTFHSTTFYRIFSISLIFTVSCTIIGTELVVMSFFERRALSLNLVPILLWPKSFESRKTSPAILTKLWVVSSILLMVFPFLPVLGGEPQDFCLVICVSLWGICVFISWSVFSSRRFQRKTSPYYVLLSILFVAVLISTQYVSNKYAQKEGLPLVSQILSWVILLTVPMLPLTCTRSMCARLLIISFSLGMVSVLLSINHDALFLPIFAFHLFVWVLVEFSNRENNSISDFLMLKFTHKSTVSQQPLNEDDFRRAFFFFFYTVFSFFATGNIASVNSFDTMWVRCFVSIFSPFTMMMLILIKIMIPFFVTACTFRAVTEITMTRVDKVFLIVLVYSDVMGLNFLFLVTNTGSWLQIGSSVSHYVISQTVILFLVLLYFLSNYLTSLKIKSAKEIIRKTALLKVLNIKRSR